MDHVSLYIDNKKQYPRYNINDIDDLDLTGINHDEILEFSQATQKWIPANILFNNFYGVYWSGNIISSDIKFVPILFSTGIKDASTVNDVSNNFVIPFDSYIDAVSISKNDEKRYNFKLNIDGVEGSIAEYITDFSKSRVWTSNRVVEETLFADAGSKVYLEFIPGVEEYTVFVNIIILFSKKI